MKKKEITLEEHYKLLNSVTPNLGFIPTRDMIVKPMEDEYVEKVITKPVDTGKKDENGYIISESKEEKESVLTTFRKGIVLRLPVGYQWPDPNSHPEVGDIVAYPRRQSTDFDLFKDSQLVNPYNVVAFIPAVEFFSQK